MKYALIALIAGLLWSCSTVKHVPEGEYLLNNVKIKVETDSTDCGKEVEPSDRKSVV